jgi:hypothetical protein
MKIFDCRKTLLQLERQPADPAPLSRECVRLRRVPLRDYTVEHLRVMIGLQVGLRYLIPLAVEQLSENPLAAGGFYPGDLLRAVLTIDPGYWVAQRALQQRVDTIAQRAFVLIADHPQDDHGVEERVLREAYAEFRYGIPEA